MVWTPDTIVNEFCTRDSTLDASNRARWHCDACAHKFPLGNMTEMRNHLINCPSLDSATIDSIKERIHTAQMTPKKVTRDSRWTKAEEKTLLKLDAELPTGKGDGRYQKMAAQLGRRSAQACRQKLIHLNEAKAVKDGTQATTKRQLWAKKTKSSKNESEHEDDEEEEFDDGSEDSDNGNMLVDISNKSPVPANRRGTRRSQPPKTMKEESSSPKSEPAQDVPSSSDATISDVNRPTVREAPAVIPPVATRSFMTDQFLRIVRWQIHQALRDFGTTRRFYSSGISIQEGWVAFMAANVPPRVKDRIVAGLIGDWLDGLDTEGFEREVDAEIENVITEMSEWDFENGNPMKKAREELPTEAGDSSYDADSSYEDDADHESMEI